MQKLGRQASVNDVRWMYGETVRGSGGNFVHHVHGFCGLMVLEMKRMNEIGWEGFVDPWQAHSCKVRMGHPRYLNKNQN
jgi:hypothetical protein